MVGGLLLPHAAIVGTSANVHITANSELELHYQM